MSISILWILIICAGMMVVLTKASKDADEYAERLRRSAQIGIHPMAFCDPIMEE